MVQRPALKAPFCADWLAVLHPLQMLWFPPTAVWSCRLIGGSGCLSLYANVLADGKTQSFHIKHNTFAFWLFFQ